MVGSGGWGLANTSLFRSEGPVLGSSFVISAHKHKKTARCLEHTKWLTKRIDDLLNAGFMCLVTRHVLFGGSGGVSGGG